MSVYTHNITQFIVEKRVFVLFFKTRLSCFSDATTENIFLLISDNVENKGDFFQGIKKIKKLKLLLFFHRIFSDIYTSETWSENSHLHECGGGQCPVLSSVVLRLTAH